MEEFGTIQDFGFDAFLMQQHQEGSTQLTLEEGRREYETDPAYQRDEPRVGGERLKREMEVDGRKWEESLICWALTCHFLEIT